MAILIDISQITLSTLLQTRDKSLVDENIIKHMALNSIRSYRTKFKKDYGEIVICCDSSTFDNPYWRKAYFPQYKASRKTSRDKSKTDWKEIYRILDAVKHDLKNYFPYKFITLPGVEADDIIGVLANYIDEKNLIVSSDKDFNQLLDNPNVDQYSHKLKKIIKLEDGYTAERTLFELVLSGDSGDGIPNFLSDSDTFVTEKRQTPLSQKRLNECWSIKDPKQFCKNKYEYDNYIRNKSLIDFSEIPTEIQERIKQEYDSVETGSRSELLSYFMRNKMRLLADHLNEF